MHISWACGTCRSEIRIQLREVPGDLFADQTGQGPNEFVLRMQPEEELYLKMTIKKPGLVRRPRCKPTLTLLALVG
jgi:glucose-6-phosphate 1-dehydrogenase